MLWGEREQGGLGIKRFAISEGVPWEGRGLRWCLSVPGERVLCGLGEEGSWQGLQQQGSEGGGGLMEHKQSGLRGVSDLGGVAVAGLGGRASLQQTS